MSLVYSLLLIIGCLTLSASSAPSRDYKWNLCVHVPLKELNHTSPWSSERQMGFSINGILFDWMVEVMLQGDNESIAYKSYFYESRPDPKSKFPLTARGEVLLRNNWNKRSKPDGSKYTHIIQNYEDIVTREKPGIKTYLFINKTIASQEKHLWLDSFGQLQFHQTVAYDN